MNKQPKNKDLTLIFLLGICSTSFGLLFLWLPMIGFPLLFVGVVLTALFIITVITILYKKMIK